MGLQIAPFGISEISGIGWSVHRPYSVGIARGYNHFSDSLLLTRAFKTKVWELSVIYSHA